MSQPSAYAPVHSFVADSAVVPNFPGQALDVEFNDVKTTTDQIRANLALIQRDDGALANAVVTYDSLSGSLQTNGITPASAWATATSYLVGNAAVVNSSLYRCLIAHTSTVFATDLAAGKWVLVTSLVYSAGSNITFAGSVISVSPSPAFTTPNIGVATATSLNGNSFTAGSYTLNGGAGKTLNFLNSLTLAGVDGTTMTFPGTSATLARTDAANTFVGTQTFGALVATTINGRSSRAANPGNLYVASTGNDSTNTGTSIGSPFLTLQHAVDVALQTYDFQELDLQIHVGSGAFVGATVAGPCFNGGNAALVILGNGSTNTTLNTTLIVDDYANVKIGSFKTTVSSGSCILVNRYSTVTLADGGMNFGGAVTALVNVDHQSAFNGSGSFGFTISGGAQYGFLAATFSNVQLSVGATYTITGTPAFSLAFVDCINGSGFNMGIGSVWSGSATGTTYALALNSWIDMEQNVSALPGNAPGQLSYNSSYYGVPIARTLSAGDVTVGVTANTVITPQTSGVATWVGGTLAGSGIGHIPGQTTNTAPAAGEIGEEIKSTVLAGSAVAMTSGATVTNVATITLTAGIWDISAQPAFTGGATTTVTALRASISPTNNSTENLASPNFASSGYAGATIFSVFDLATSIAPFRVALSGSQQYWLNVRGTFATSTCSGYGTLRAVRVA